MKKEKMTVAPNEASLRRWIGTLAVGLLLGILLCVPGVLPLALIPALSGDVVMGIPKEPMLLMISFAALFWGMVLAIRWVAKTSLRDFVLGVGGKANWKEVLPVLGMFALGILISTVFPDGDLQRQKVHAGEFAFLVVFMLVMVFMQTTCEELISRGLFIRWACGNKVGYTKRSALAFVLSSLMFMILHGTNVEVISLGGVQSVMALLAYIIPGFMLFWVDLHCKNLLPGILIHWVNNFWATVVIRAEVTSLPLNTLFISRAPHSGGLMLLGTLVLYAPLAIYLTVATVKQKKAK